MVSCLAQLLLDPQTRTRAGFERLVQREWVLLGHPFQERIGLVQAPEGKKVRGRATALGGGCEVWARGWQWSGGREWEVIG